MAMTTVSKGNSIEIDVVRASLEPDYEILEELGRGGMAIVYRAKERELDREVAIKVLPAMLAMYNEFVERFQHEARTAGKLEHPNIVPIYRVGRSGHVIYFVMKLLQGQSLGRVLKERGKLSVGEVRRILIETASALGYASRRHVVHRDIKPDNILLDSEGRCVITDFGIAKAPGGQNTAAGTSLGTPKYMSPEHAQGIKLDGRSDMYSLGIVAYQSLTGATPFDAEDPFAILYKHINEPLPRPELHSDEEFALYAVIERMLSKKAEDRFQSAEDMVIALGGHVSEPTLVSQTLPSLLVAGQPTEIIPTPTYGTRIKRFWTSDWRAWAVGAVLIVVAGTAVNLLTAPEAPPAASIAPGTKTPVPPVVGSSTGATSARLAGDSAAAARAAVTPPAATKTAPPPVRQAFSKCPARPTQPTLLVDRIPPQRRGTTLPVNFDVCGLRAGAPFTGDFTFRKQNQRNPFSRQADVTKTFPDVAATSRYRRRRLIDLAGLSPGTYQLAVVITTEQGRDIGKTVNFEIRER